MSFDDWIKEANKTYIYVSFVSKGTSANSGKIKLIKHEQEIFKLRDEDITIKKYLLSVNDKINQTNGSDCQDNLNCSNSYKNLNNLDNRISCREFLTCLQNEKDNNDNNEKEESDQESPHGLPKNDTEILLENYKRKQLENTLKILKKRYSKNKIIKNTDGDKKKRGRPKKITNITI
jgi:hypothetical protein